MAKNTSKKEELNTILNDLLLRLDKFCDEEAKNLPEGVGFRLQSLSQCREKNNPLKGKYGGLLAMVDVGKYPI